MKSGWIERPFEECIEPIKLGAKVQRKDSLEVGDYPVVSQEDAFINGYWNEPDDLLRLEHPVVVFGDHTRTLKYIDFDFVLGADGVKVLSPREFLDPKFFYYQLHTARPDSLGYARHYRLLRESCITYPALDEQRRIVAILDEAFAGIATAKANAEKSLRNVEELFGDLRAAAFRSNDWSERPFEDCIEHATYTNKIQRKQFLSAGQYPIVSQEEDFINGYWNNSADVFSVDRALVLFGDHTKALKYVDFNFVLGADGVKILNPKPFLNPRFFYHQLRTAKLKSLGYARHYRLLKELIVRYPSLDEQERIAAELDSSDEQAERLQSLYTRKLTALDELKQSLLHQAFSGQL